MGHVFTDARPLSSSAIIRTWKKEDGALLSASSVAFHGIPQRVETRGKNPFSFSTRGKWGNVRNWTGITQMILRISSFSSFTSSYWTRWSIWKIRYDSFFSVSKVFFIVISFRILLWATFRKTWLNFNLIKARNSFTIRRNSNFGF